MILHFMGRVFRFHCNFIRSRTCSSGPYVNSKAYIFILMKQKQMKKTPSYLLISRVSLKQTWSA